MNLFNLNFPLLCDPLSGFFLFVIFVVSFPVAIYAFSYLKGEYSSTKIALSWILLIVFVLSMVLVVTVANALAFLIVWEIMSLVSYFLVIFDTDQEKSIQAGTIYIVMTHIGTIGIAVAFLLMYKQSGSFDFGALKQACLNMPLSVRNFVFLLLLFGFGTKIGLVPLHIWLPYAHPQSPSHISALMSAVMIKTAVYGMIRFIFCILGIGSLWWGNLILILALLSCLVGAMYALTENDLKKLLAYSSIENIGIIMLSLGASIVLIKLQLPLLAVFAFLAGLYHLVNHAIFKGLLFLSAGSVCKSCRTKNIEKMGGLIKSMPWTAVAFLFGSLSISAIPPFNGFVSEWLTWQAFFLGALNSPAGYKIFFSLCACLLALTGGLAAACFVKAFGITFLALPRSTRALEAKEAGWSMKLAMSVLALLTVIFGLVAGLMINPLAKVAASVIGLDMTGVKFSLNNFVLLLPATKQVFLSVPLLVLAFGLTAGMVLGLIHWRWGRNKIRVSKTWDCGYYQLTSRNEYNGTAFSKPFRIAFSFFLLPYHKTEKIKDSFYYVRFFKYEVYTTSVFKRYFYQPLVKLVFDTANFAHRIQPGSIHLYIAYIFVTMLVLVFFNQIWP